jgi:hypothetical protein
VLGGASDSAHCPRTDRGDIALIDDLMTALPPVQGDAADYLLAQGIRVDLSTNTYHKTPTLRTRFSSTAVILLPTPTAGLSASDARFVLRNEDCGAAIVFVSATEQRELGSSPLAFAIPASACPAFRWANEGVRLVQAADSNERTCRGGVEGGIASCVVDNDATCASNGGTCAQPPSVEGVAYRNAKTHFECTECFTDALCGGAACANHACCVEEVLHWYKYPTPALVYAGHQFDLDEEVLQQSDE